MRISPNKSRIRSFTVFYKGETARALRATYEPIINKAVNTPPEDLKRSVKHLLKPNHIESTLRDLYLTVGSHFDTETHKALNRQKADPQTRLFNWQRYANERAKLIAGKILDTQEENINTTIDHVVERLTAEGLSIVDITNNLKDELESELTDILGWEAQRIAQTEVVGSANYGSFTGAKESGVDVAKAWITSGNANVRESHNYYQSLGEQPMDYEYNYSGEGTGLQFPGDPQCTNGSDVINCHCTVVYITQD